MPTALLLDLVSPLPGLDTQQLRAWGRGRTVMISSTMRDLGPERAAVADTITEFGAAPRYFEGFSSPGDPGQVYNPEVSRADIYLFIAGERYGNPDPNDPQKRSATHIEYDTAYSSYKPVLAYNKLGVEREAGMTRLVNQLEGVHTVSRFHTLEDLKQLVREGLTRLAEADSTTWVKIGPAVFPVESVTFPPATGTPWNPQQQTRSIAMQSSLRDPQILSSLRSAFHSQPLTLAREVYTTDQIELHEERAGRFAVSQRITAVLRPATGTVLSIIPISNGESGDEQLGAALDSLLFGRATSRQQRTGAHSFIRELRPVSARLAQLHQQLAVHHRDAELFVPMAELLLTDRLLRGTPEDPAPLTHLEYLFVSPAVKNKVFVRVVGTHEGGNFGGSYRITREGQIDFQGTASTVVQGW